MQVASTGGIVLDTCKAVTLKGSAILTYQWDQYPYAQGTLLNVTEDQVNLTVQVGHPMTIFMNACPVFCCALTSHSPFRCFSCNWHHVQGCR